MKLPGSLSLPDGELTLGTDGGENLATILCGGTVVGTLELGMEDGPTLQEDSLAISESDNGFSFTVSAPGERFAEGETYELTFTLYAGNLVRSAGAISDPVTLTVQGEGGEPASDSASVTVTAGEDVPGQGGWTVAPTQYETVSQRVFWADNNDEAGGRPEWSKTLGDTESGMTPRLYYTLTEVNADGKPIRTFQPQELTAEEWEKVGLTGMPTLEERDDFLYVDYVDAAGVEGKGLPSRLEERDANGTVNRYYTVSWSLEPPDTSTLGSYTLQDVEVASAVEGVSQEGWYFVLLDEFTVTVDVQQGIAGPLTEDQLLALLDNFTFFWDYDGREDTKDDGKNTLKAMLEDGLNAKYDVEAGTLTISGLWKYSLNGDEIVYSLRETADDGETDATADGRLSNEELDAFFGEFTEPKEAPWRPTTGTASSTTTPAWRTMAMMTPPCTAAAS